MADACRLRLQRQSQKKRVFFCRTAGGRSLAVHPDGRLFPCGQTLEDTCFQAGDVNSLVFMPLFPADDLAECSQHCQDCPLRYSCPNDCPVGSIITALANRSCPAFCLAPWRNIACNGKAQQKMDSIMRFSLPHSFMQHHVFLETGLYS